LSQVILSLQLSFAVVPLVQFTSDKKKMGEFANPLWLKVLAWMVAMVIISLNAIFIVPNILWLRNSKPHYLFADNEVYCF